MGAAAAQLGAMLAEEVQTGATEDDRKRPATIAREAQHRRDVRRRNTPRWSDFGGRYLARRWSGGCILPARRRGGTGVAGAAGAKLARSLAMMAGGGKMEERRVRESGNGRGEMGEGEGASARLKGARGGRGPVASGHAAAMAGARPSSIGERWGPRWVPHRKWREDFGNGKIPVDPFDPSTNSLV